MHHTLAEVFVDGAPISEIVTVCTSLPLSLVLRQRDRIQCYDHSCTAWLKREMTSVDTSATLPKHNINHLRHCDI